MAATIKDVAALAQVSVGTVSRYLNGYEVSETNKRKIDEAIRRLDFKLNPVARSLKTSKSMTVAVVVPALANIFSMSIIEGIERHLDQYGYSVIVCDSQSDVQKEKSKLQFVKDKYVDGVVIMPTGSDGTHITEVLGDELPAVLMDRLVEDVKLDAVLVDNVNAVYQAVERLITLGHRRIGMITGPKDIYTAKERQEGYRRVFVDYNLPIDENLIRYGDYTEDTGYKLMSEFMRLDCPPTAVFVANYEMTIGAIMAVNEFGIQIPDQLSLIGFDQLELSKLIKPSLSVVVQPMAEIGQKAAEMLYQRMRGNCDNFPQVIRLKAHFIEGQSIKRL
ncbi:LacI family DNA-binding transcriptional regulator [Mahella australiensis]|uniref:Transcriptional regulator, LacI family n=1 Tax=Mahella australiensis (strain DSM 15567 / CIP 107919 / 50-1 BON) TaxID=697281 RepID=F3ZVS4_MAHA5|nr:LacI family DNA-binding transcriptional regulator [Mahella australiensis]AEE97468.1 transcriptional regulator, LacI family [Mahella australiensis 50-1 BON]